MFRCPRCGHSDPIGIGRCCGCGYQFVGDPSEWPDGKPPAAGNANSLTPPFPGCFAFGMGCGYFLIGSVLIPWFLVLASCTRSGVIVVLVAALVASLGWVVLGWGAGPSVVVFGVIAAGLVTLSRRLGFRWFDRVGGGDGSRFVGLPVQVIGMAAVVTGGVLVLVRPG